MEYKNGNWDFIERTKELLEDSYSNKKYEVTTLLNFSLGLLLNPFEKLINGKSHSAIFDRDISTFEKLKKLDLNCYFKADIKKNNSSKLVNLIREIRNGIAHQHVEALDEDGDDQIDTIKISDFYYKKKCFELKTTPDNYCKLLLFLYETVKKECKIK